MNEPQVGASVPMCMEPKKFTFPPLTAKLLLFIYLFFNSGSVILLMGGSC